MKGQNKKKKEKQNTDDSRPLTYLITHLALY